MTAHEPGQLPTDPETYTDVAGRTGVGSRGVLIERRLGEIVRQPQPVIDDPRHGMTLTGGDVDPYGLAPMREGIAQQVAQDLAIFRRISLPVTLGAPSNVTRRPRAPIDSMT